MANTADIANDMRNSFGAFLSVGEISEYTGCSRQSCYILLTGVEPVYTGRAPRYFYKDVATAMTKPRSKQKRVV